MEVTSNILLRLKKLNQIGRALSHEKNLTHLLEQILMAAKEFAHADGGTVYKVTKEFCKFETLCNDSLGISMGGTSGQKISFPAIPLYLEDKKENHNAVVAHVALTGKTINIDDAYTVEGFDFCGTRKFDKMTGYRSKSFLTVPMKIYNGHVIGVIQLINAKNPLTNEIISFSLEDEQLLESLASQAAIVLNNHSLTSQLETLFESLIQLINNAIDEKSPYTGGHCKRVPVLTMMLAEAVSRVQYGPFQSFQMTEEDKYELKISGLLHDCGKITTPVHVIDKRTKLETIFDRIALVDTRFQILKRDLEILHLKGKISFEDYNTQLAQVESDNLFIREVNIGGEFLNDDKLNRIKTIASQQWVNNEGKLSSFLSEDELENLIIRRGTLTAKERDIINHHIDVTINMLEKLPWPQHLKNVPEFAGGHHERMDGKGYPKGLKRENMSVQARIMGIADIFEALTARDRPYKPGKTLTESLNILGKMKLDNHIDPDLFDIFVREKVYLQYANEFLEPEQIDNVNDNAIPGFERDKL